jgi:mRNA interferase MazF
VVAYTPDRGDIIWLDFDPQQGHKIKKRRPALVLSPKIYHKKTHLALCVPITSQVKGYPFEVVFQHTEIAGAMLSDHIKSLDWRARNVRYICRLPEAQLDIVKAKLMTLL